MLGEEFSAPGWWLLGGGNICFPWRNIVGIWCGCSVQVFSHEGHELDVQRSSFALRTCISYTLSQCI